MISSARQCDKCQSAAAQYLLPTSDLAFCAHDWAAVPEDVRAHGQHLRTSLGDQGELDAITQAIYTELTADLDEELDQVSKVSHLAPAEFVSYAAFKDIVS
jgi:hypothetical protein